MTKLLFDIYWRQHKSTITLSPIKYNSRTITLLSLKYNSRTIVLFAIKYNYSRVSHTLNNSSDLVLRHQPQYLMQRCIKRLGISWCHYYALDPLSKNVIDMFKLLTCLMSKLTSHCAHHRFAEYNEVCSGIGILGLVCYLFSHKKGKTTDLNVSSMYDWSSVPLYHQICCPGF